MVAAVWSAKTMLAARPPTAERIALPHGRSTAPETANRYGDLTATADPDDVAVTVCECVGVGVGCPPSCPSDNPAPGPGRREEG